MRTRRWPDRMTSSRRRGGCSMTPGLGGSTPSAMAGGPSAMMLTNRIWMALKMTPRPPICAARIVRIAEMFVVSWKRTNVMMLS